MRNLNKPAKDVLVDLINDTSRRINPHWVDIPAAAFVFGTPAAQARVPQYDHRNTFIDAFDVTDTQMQVPYRLNYDRIDLKDLTRRHENDLYVYLPVGTTAVSKTNLLSAINSAAGTQLVAGDIVTGTVNTPSFPATIEIDAHADSLIFYGTGKVTVSIPTDSVALPVTGELSALMARRFAAGNEDANVANNHGFVMTLGLPANVGVSRYLEHYDRTAGDLQQERAYSRYALIADDMVVEPYSVVTFVPNSQVNFHGEEDDLLNMVVLIGEELCLVQGVTFDGTDTTLVTGLALRRAVDDTIPVSHVAGSTLYMFNESGPKGLIPVDKLNNVNIKLLAKIGVDVEAEGGVPYISNTFRNRLNRPYAPRNVRVNGLWDATVEGVGRSYTVTWEHHRRFDVDGNRVVDELGWFDHALVETGDDDVEYQVQVYVQSSNALLYSSPRLTGTSHTFDMPEFDGAVYLRVVALKLSVECYQIPTLYFDVVEGSGFEPIFGNSELVADEIGFTIIVDVASPGSPASVGFTDGDGSYPYTIDWQVDVSGVWTSVDTNTHSIAYADLTEHAGRNIRARLSMTNTHGTVHHNSFVSAVPA